MISLSSSSSLLLLLLLISNQSHLPLLFVTSDKYCGIDINDASTKCWQPCSSDIDCCSITEKCYDAPITNTCGSNDKSGSQHYYCGISWCDAAYTCGTPCPNEDECADGEYCFADTPCDSTDENNLTPPILPPPPTSSPYMYCGKSIEDAKLNCWQPCPRGDVDCCSGLTCYDTTSSSEAGGRIAYTCDTSVYSGTSHYYCGASWCDAAYTCTTSCASGKDTDCPTGQYCYADTPCDGTRIVPEIYDSSSDKGASNNVTTTTPPLDDSVNTSPVAAATATTSSFLASFTSYCGTSQEHATELCWQPCRDNDDCCANQTCYTNITSCTTTTDQKWSNNIGADHFFCGKDYCDASYECKAPCSSGYDAQCPLGLRCLPNTPCNANIRSFSSSGSSDGRLEYGLPTRALDLYQQYQSSSNNGFIIDEQQQSQKKTRNVIVGLFFGICIITLLGMNYMLYQRRRLIDGATVAKTKNQNRSYNNDHDERRIDDTCSWLYRDIKVRIISKSLDNGIYYKRKGIIKRIINNYYADVELLPGDDGPKELLHNIHQNDLETVIPTPMNTNSTNTTSTRVRIVNGRYRGNEARVIRLNKSEYYAELLLLNNGEVEEDRNISRRNVIVADYEDFSAIA